MIALPTKPTEGDEPDTGFIARTVENISAIGRSRRFTVALLSAVSGASILMGSAGFIRPTIITQAGEVYHNPQELPLGARVKEAYNGFGMFRLLCLFFGIGVALVVMHLANRYEDQEFDEAEEEGLETELTSQIRQLNQQYRVAQYKTRLQIEAETKESLQRAQLQRQAQSEFQQVLETTATPVTYNEAPVDREIPVDATPQPVEKEGGSGDLWGDTSGVTISPVAETPEPTENTITVKDEATGADTHLSADDKPLGRSKDVLAAMHRLNLPCELVDVHIGPTTEQYRLKPIRKSTGASRLAPRFLNAGQDLEIEMGLFETPMISIEKGAIAVTLAKEARDTLKFDDYVKPTLDRKGPIQAVIGVDIYGHLHTIPIESKSCYSIAMGGIPGGGKSSFILSLMGSIAATATPKECQFIVFDGKGGVELKKLDGSPYLKYKVACDRLDASSLMLTVRSIIKRRFDLFTETGVSDLDEYNAKVEPEKRLPYLLVVVDEFQELFDLNKTPSQPDEDDTDVENMASNASLGRAAGVLVILSTQRVDGNSIPEQINSKVPVRIAFSLITADDSKKILSGRKGAENLLGKGDMLYLKPDTKNLIRLQGLHAEWGDIKPHLFSHTG